MLDFCHSCIDEWRLNTRANFKYIVAMELMIGAVKISSEDVMKTHKEAGMYHVVMKFGERFSEKDFTTKSKKWGEVVWKE